MTNALNLVKKYANREKELLEKEFLSCFIPGIYDVFTDVDGIRRRFYVDEDFSEHGFAFFEPLDQHSAKMVRKAEDFEIRDYLDRFKQLKVIAIYDLGEVWVCLPANYQEAQQKYNIERGKFVVVRGADSIQPFDFVIAKKVGENFWFYDIDYAMDAEVSINFRENFEAKKKEARVRNSTPECRDAYKIAFDLKNKYESLTIEERIKKTLEETECELVSYIRKKSKLIEIVWKNKSGKQYTSHISEVDFSVISAGVCLGGTRQNILNLKSLPSVISQGEREKRIYLTLGRRRNYDDDYEDDYDDDYDD